MSSVAHRAAASLKNAAAKPIMSSTPAEARRRVLAHYKQWYRAVPEIIRNFQLPYKKEKVYAKLREEFLKNSHVRDLRAIDILVIKGEMELQETLLLWKQPCHVREYFDAPLKIKQPTGFLGKFLAHK